MKLLILQGPNLNLLGTREPGVYGRKTLAEIQADLDAAAAVLDVSLEHVQSNHEGELVDAVQRAAEQGVHGALVNAGAYTHTSIALRDALAGTSLPFIEVHLSNVYAREPFRHRSLLSDLAIGLIVGLGPRGYTFALEGLVQRLRQA